MALRQRHRKNAVWIFILVALGYIAYEYSPLFNSATSPLNAKTGEFARELQKELVVASMKGDNTSWLEENFAGWWKNLYVVDDRAAELTVVRNKGREGMVYLTYIIDRYTTLPPISVFIHSARYAWHNEDPLYDAVPVLTNLRLPHVLARGFVSLRCTWAIGCPAELAPKRSNTADMDDRSQTEPAYAAAFQHFFPGVAIPHVIGAHCGGQFAVFRDRIRARPLTFYTKIQKWLLDTDLSDQISGRVMEYMWHIIFGMPAQDCQDTETCFCETFGLCDLTCEEGSCEKRWQVPVYKSLPVGWPKAGGGRDGWPEVGWAD